MKKKRPFGWAVWTIAMFVLSPLLFADVVKEVGPDGGLVMEDGRKFVLAGIKVDSDGASILRVLARKQDVRLEILNAVRAPDGGECAYAYLRTKSHGFPSNENVKAGEEDVMVNEFLVRIGAAKVDETQDFAHKAAFLKIQEEAKRKGEGVWSYVGS